MSQQSLLLALMSSSRRPEKAGSKMSSPSTGRKSAKPGIKKPHKQKTSQQASASDAPTLVHKPSGVDEILAKYNVNQLVGLKLKATDTEARDETNRGFRKIKSTGETKEVKESKPSMAEKKVVFRVRE